MKKIKLTHKKSTTIIYVMPNFKFPSLTISRINKKSYNRYFTSGLFVDLHMKFNGMLPII